LIVGICGGSASGKTTLAKELSERLADLEPLVLNQDRYFRDWSDVPAEEREEARTANRPEAVRWPILIEHVRLLRAGQPAPQPPPGTRASSRGEPPGEIKAEHLVIVEGHLLLWNEELRGLLDLKVFLDVPVDERVIRRVLRDMQRGSGDLERVVAWYRRDVLPNYPIYTETCRAFADLVLPFARPNPVAVTAVAAAIRQMIQALQAEEQS
jgi:uridine kinase